MNKDEARKRLEIIEDEARELRKMIDAPDGHIILKHGDYGYDRFGMPCLCIQLAQGGLKDVGQYCMHENCGDSGSENSSSTDRVAKKIGNIFDDLEKIKNAPR